MFAALMALSPARRIAASLGGAALLLLVGAGLMIAWEHRSPWGLEAKRANLERQIEDPITGLQAQLHQMTGDRDGHRAATARCEAKRAEENSDAADAVTRASDQQARASGSAFNQGYAAGRAVGLQQCGASRENSPNPSDVGDPPAPGGLRDDGTDLAGSWNRGAYQPGGGLPPQR